MPAFVVESDRIRTPADTFAYMINVENWPGCTGHGPLRGIVRASSPGGTMAVGTLVRCCSSLR
ncbi:MAG: hypothetical protein EXR69_09960 [Myxococcales bacterium]|nr:hypothetical protein [Myxococcales bacterium]